MLKIKELRNKSQPGKCKLVSGAGYLIAGGLSVLNRLLIV